MKAEQLFKYMMKEGFQIWKDQEHIGYRAPRKALDDRLKSEIRVLRQELLSLLEEGKTYAPLSNVQENIWILETLHQKGLPQYRALPPLTVKGWLDTEALIWSFNETVKRHEILRTGVEWVCGMPVQVIYGSCKSNIEIRSLTGCGGESPRKAGKEEVKAFIRKGVELGYPPLFKVLILREDESLHTVQVVLHQIISDGWSAGLLMREVERLYNSRIRGETGEFAGTVAQYHDYLLREKDFLDSPDYEEGMKFWQENLKDAPQLQDMPRDICSIRCRTFEAGETWFSLDAALSRNIRTACRKNLVTPFVFMLGGFGLLMKVFTGSRDLVIGVPVANRTDMEFEDVMGRFSNTLPYRIKINNTLTVKEYLSYINRLSMDNYRHQRIPFSHMVESLSPERIPGKNPWFQSLFAFQQSTGNLIPALNGLEIWGEEPFEEYTPFDLAVQAWECGDKYRFKIEYSRDCFKHSTMELFARRLAKILDIMSASQDISLGEIDYLFPEEKELLLYKWNQTEKGFPQEEHTVAGLFARKALEIPDATALEYGSQKISYFELYTRASRLAGNLMRLGIGRESRVGIYYERSPEMIASILGIMLAGGAYMPIAPENPPGRTRLMLEDACPELILVQDCLWDKIGRTGFRTVKHGDVCSPACAEAAGADNRQASNKSLAYIIFTSGSTGRPKGVMVEHGNLANLVHSQLELFKITRKSRVLQFAPLHFDASVSEIFTTLSAGGTLVLAGKNELLPGTGLTRLLKEKRITTLTITPSILAYLPWDELPDLSVIISAGEQCRDDLVSRWSAPGRIMLNAYGPTEATVCAACGLLGCGENAVSSVGQPIANVCIYILDENMRPVPKGTAGEIYIGGKGVSRGYVNREDLNREVFLKNPFKEEGVVYRTGDRGRWLDGGEIEFLGRLDDQVKIRGMRIETEEISAVLRSHPLVKNACVLLDKESKNGPALNAYLVPDIRPDNVNRERAKAVGKWQTFYDRHYSRLYNGQDTEAGFAGWNSSYDGKPMPEDQMLEWQSSTVERLLGRRPERVLEIGCGSGLILERLAPHTRLYHATDFSEAVLGEAENKVKYDKAEPNEGMRFFCRPADDFGGLEGNGYDLVIINSVVQYFPDAYYLIKVLNGALRCLGSKGTLFLGDLRNYSLLPAFHTSVELFKSSPDKLLGDLRIKVRQRIREEKELCVSPGFIRKFYRDHPDVDGIEIMPKQMRSQNEISLFRYDVFLHKGQGHAAFPQNTGKELETAGMEGLQSHILKSRPRIFALKGLADRELQRYIRAASLVMANEYPKRNIQWLLDRIGKGTAGGTELYDIKGFMEEHGYDSRAELGEEPGTYDIVFVRRDSREIWDLMPDIHKLKQAEEQERECVNAPIVNILRNDLASEMHSFLVSRLPDYMIPKNIIILEEIPVNASGKLDKKELLELTAQYRDNENQNTENNCTGKLEEQISAAWSDALERKNIGADKNFFDLGGHSLLVVQVHERLQRDLDMQFPIISIFQYPTIRGLANHLSALNGAKSPEENAAHEADDENRPSTERGWLIRERRRKLMVKRGDI